MYQKEEHDPERWSHDSRFVVLNATIYMSPPSQVAVTYIQQIYDVCNDTLNVFIMSLYIINTDSGKVQFCNNRNYCIVLGLGKEDLHLCVR